MVVSELAPGDEHANVELMREQMVSGNTSAALRQYERFERVLERELGVSPGPEARALRDRVEETGRTAAVSPIDTAGRPVVERILEELSELMRRQAMLLETLAQAPTGGGRTADCSR